MVVNFPAKDQGVWMFWLAAQDGLNLIESLLEVFLVHKHLGTGVMDFNAGTWCLDTHQLIKLGHGSTKILRGTVDLDRSQSGAQTDI